MPQDRERKNRSFVHQLRLPALALALILIGLAILATSTLNSLHDTLAQQAAITVTSITYLPAVMRQVTPTSTPTLTSTPTPTKTSTPTATATRTVSPPGTATFFPVGPGGSDVIPHQIVRTGNDHVYIFVSQQYSRALHVYWTTATGLPTTTTHFSSTQITASDNPISLDAVYNGNDTIHVLVNAQDGTLKDYPFDPNQNRFRATLTLVASGNPTVPGDYVGTSGVSGMINYSGTLHIAFWSAGNHVTYRAYTYDSSTNALTQVGSSFQVDSSGSANHPSIAVSPLDGSVTVAWVSEATVPAKILARTRTSAGVWGSIETASTAPVWTSTIAGISIDQGPSLIIEPNGTRHLAYIENYDSTNDYGRIHHVVNSSTNWTDQALNAYTHNPALALNSRGELYIIGHSHPKNPGTICKTMDDMCFMKQNSSGTWGTPQLFAPHTGPNSFDSSPSVKWAVVGFNRPETIEFIFFMTPYNNPTVYYGRLP